MTATGGTVGVLGLLEPRQMSSPERLHLLEAFANQRPLLLEWLRWYSNPAGVGTGKRRSFSRNTLLSSVSHDLLRTPLATITGRHEQLLRNPRFREELRRELAAEIVSESERMERLIANLSG